MYVVSLELCRELHAVSLWADTEESWYDTRHITSNVNDFALATTDDARVDFLVAPAYVLGYLLRKLNGSGLQLEALSKGKWVCKSVRFKIQRIANSPEDAVARLAVDLFRQGILVQDEPNLA